MAFVGLFACAHRDPQREFDQARQTFVQGNLIGSQREAETSRKYFQNLNPEWAWKFRILEAEALMWRGMSQEVLALLSSESYPRDPGVAIPLLTLKGIAHVRLQNRAAADRELGEAEQLCESSSDANCGGVIRARGVQAWESSQFLRAGQLFQQSLSFARTHGDAFLESTALLNLGAASLQQEHFDEAIDWCEAAVGLSTRLGFGDIVLNASGNLGWAYYKLGDSEKALAYFLDAQQRATQLGDVINQLRWLTTAGYVYLDGHQFLTAEHSYQQALGFATQINSRGDIRDALLSLALVYSQTERLEQGKEYADRALAMARAEGNRVNELYALLVEAQVAARRHATTQAESELQEVANDIHSPVFLKWEAEHSLAGLYEALNQESSADREYRQALATFETARSTLHHEDSDLAFVTNALRIYDDYIHFLVTQGKTNQALQIADYSRARTLTEGLGLLRKGTSFSPEPVDARQIARRAAGAILFYWLGEKQSYLWAITPQKTSLFPLPSASEIDAAVKRYRKALAGPQDVLEAGSAGGSFLFQTLVGPAVKLLPQNARVFVVPDGSLNSLNFETLLVPGPQPHYWIEDVTIADASSLRVLEASHGAHKSTGKLLLFGDAVAPTGDYPPLPKAAAEMERIARHFVPAQQQIMARDRATPPAYLASKPEQFSYIHFVAHGTASRLSPLDSAIVLSKATAEDDSFKLYARDIILHRLRAELVTISTCYGAGTRAYSGEGLVGLSWAFLRAGAHNVIGALWEVSDVSTPQLMDQLYDGLRKGESPGTALRAAKLSLLHSNSAFRKPFYWAPFQLYTGS